MCESNRFTVRVNERLNQVWIALIALLLCYLEEGGPYHAQGHLNNYISWLEQTGREYAIPELKRRHPKEFQ